MNSTRVWPALLTALWLGAFVGAVRADDWKTSDGKTYEDVKLMHVDQDTVTILHKDGGAQIPMEKLSPDLQKRFGYDPATAKLAAEEHKKEAAANAKALQAEMDQASEMHQAGKEPDADTTETSDDATGPVASKSTTSPATSSGSHHFMDEIVNGASGQKKSAPDASHHSIDDATQGATAMRPSLSDPNYHTMAHMFYTVRQGGLGPDTSDTSHHSMDDAVQAASQQK